MVVNDIFIVLKCFKNFKISVLKVFDINDLFEAKNILYWATDVDAEGRAFELKGGSLLYITFTTISIFLYMQNLLPENLYASTFLN